MTYARRYENGNGTLPNGGWLPKAFLLEPASGMYWLEYEIPFRDVLAAAEKSFPADSFYLSSHGSRFYFWRKGTAEQEAAYRPQRSTYNHEHLDWLEKRA